MSLRVIFLSVFLVLGGTRFVRSDIPPKPSKPECISRGWPPQTLLLSSLSLKDDKESRNISYQAHYCHPSKKTKYCFKPPFGYKKVCTFNHTNKIGSTLFKCNMTNVIWKIYPDLVNPTLPSTVKGSTLCMVISAGNENGTIYSKIIYYNVRLGAHCSGITDIQVVPSAKGEITITWGAPSDISYSMSKVLKYTLRYTGNSESKIINFNTFTDGGSSPRQHTVTIKNLAPYTQYSVELSCYFLWSSDHFTLPVVVRTLPEAPYSRPVITGVQKVSMNSTMKTVRLEWKHPPKNKRNGIILKSVVECWSYRNLSDSSLPVHGYNLTINGSKTNASLSGLHVDLDYFVTVRSCTVKCSEKSLEYQIKRELNGPRPPQASTGSPFSSTTFTILLVVLVVVLAVIVGIFFIVRRQKKKSIDRVPRDPLPDDIQVSNISSEENDRGSVGFRENDDSDYALPSSQLTGVESHHDRASMLQNETNGHDQGNKVSSMEKIPLC